jgi:hypothetical protein
VDVGWTDNLELLPCLGWAALRSENHDIVGAEDNAYKIT